MMGQCVLISVAVLLIGFTSYCIVADIIGTKDDPDHHNNHCECINYDCGCCTQLEIKNIIDGDLCTNFSYLPNDYGISVTITYNNRTILNETVSARNPPPICIIHIDKIQMQFCLHFYNLDIKNKHFSGCVELEISFFHLFPLKHIQFGCWGKQTSQSKRPILHEELRYMLEFLEGKSKQSQAEPEVILT